MDMYTVGELITKPHTTEHLKYRRINPCIVDEYPASTRDSFYWHDFTLILVWISNYIQHKVGDAITYPSLTFNGCTVEVVDWISYFIPHFPGHSITYSCCDQS